MEWYMDFTANLSWLGIVAGAIAVLALALEAWRWWSTRNWAARLEQMLAQSITERQQQGTEIARLQEEAASQREAQSRERIAISLMHTYQDSLLRAAQDLQSKLFNILRLHLFRNFYFDGSFSEKEYSVENTLYVIAEYLCWVEIMRREVQFLTAAQEQQNRQMMEYIDTVTQLFLTSGLPSTFRVFRGEQRAIGEIMLTALDPDSARREPVGYAAFLKKRKDEDFSRWFRQLRMDVDDLANGGGNTERLVRLQNALVGLIDCLDPSYVKVPQDIRSKVQASEVSLP